MRKSKIKMMEARASQMEDASAIALLSLGQVLATVKENIAEPGPVEMIERHVRQVAAIVLAKPFNKIDGQTEALISEVEALCKTPKDSSN